MKVKASVYCTIQLPVFAGLPLPSACSLSMQTGFPSGVTQAKTIISSPMASWLVLGLSADSQLSPPNV